MRGELSRWLMEPRPGVFLGNASRRVREELWQMAVLKCKRGSVMQFWSSPAPQGYSGRIHGTAARDLVDFEGITLAVKRDKSEEKGGSGK
ncbi:MAG: type I-E CRISPR-associated endoribonuclease Cas2e [Candidatus Brocadiia bacterium]